MKNFFEMMLTSPVLSETSQLILFKINGDDCKIQLSKNIAKNELNQYTELAKKYIGSTKTLLHVRTEEDNDFYWIPVYKNHRLQAMLMIFPPFHTLEMDFMELLDDSPEFDSNKSIDYLGQSCTQLHLQSFADILGFLI
ncbi:MAG: hypothetical protein HON94_14455 [Methylococcales bacterium]|nr:hypothetical protein [Methylococcales bacterium]MBT7410529.1 hypothetical protein [Methylococcales bacterium]